MNKYEKLMQVQNKLKAPKIKEGKRTYYLINCCMCGKEMKVRSDYIYKHSGICISCQKKNNKQALKHGDAKKRLYGIWEGLKHRRYSNYNPSLCKDWEDYNKFKEWALSNGYNDKLTIDRINNKGDYEPNNCQWITLAQNAGKDKKIYTLQEEIKIYKKRIALGLTQRDMAKKLNVSRNTIQRAEKNAKVAI